MKHDDPAQGVGLGVVTSLYGLLRSLQLYEPNNDAVARVLDQLEQQLATWFAQGRQELRIQLLEEEFFVNGRLLRVDSASFARARDLASALAQFQISEVTFGPEIGRDALLALARDASSAYRGQRVGLASGYGPLELRQTQGRSVASFRYEPDRLAIWTYASLLDVTEALYREHEAGGAPSLLPVRRVLQLSIDGMRSHSGIFQLLNAVRDPGRKKTVPARRVAVAIDAIGFGLFVDLAPASTLSIGLAGLLGGLASPDAGPEQAVEPLFRFPGLGETGPGLVLALHDARAVKQGGSSGLRGKMLAVVEAWHELLDGPPDHPSTAPPVALALLASGKVPGVDANAARVFGAFKGRYPLGSPVQLSDGTIAVVVSLGDDEAHQERPWVAPWLPPDQLGPWIDLRGRPDLAISGTPTPARVGLDLKRT